MTWLFGTFRHVYNICIKIYCIFRNVKISLAKEDSVIPFTAGVHAQPSEDAETCLVVFFFDGREESTATNFIRKFSQDRVSS